MACEFLASWIGFLAKNKLERNSEQRKNFEVAICNAQLNRWCCNCGN